MLRRDELEDYANYYGIHEYKIDGYDIKNLAETALHYMDRYEEAMRLFQDLTPNGSEFAYDPVACHEYVKDRLKWGHEKAKEFIKLQRKVSELEDRLQGLFNDSFRNPKYGNAKTRTWLRNKIREIIGEA